MFLYIFHSMRHSSCFHDIALHHNERRNLCLGFPCPVNANLLKRVTNGMRSSKEKEKARRRWHEKKTKITNNVKRSVVWVAIVLFLIHLAALCIWPLALSLFRHAKVVYSSKMYILLLTINGVWNNVYTSCATGQYEKEAARMWADGTTMNV